MTYTIIIKKQAKKKLQSLPYFERTRIAEKIEFLGYNPDDPTLDIKKLIGHPYFRLRVGDWRVIFDRQDKIKIIAIEKLASRGDIYK